MSHTFGRRKEGRSEGSEVNKDDLIEIHPDMLDKLLSVPAMRKGKWTLPIVMLLITRERKDRISPEKGTESQS